MRLPALPSVKNCYQGSVGYRKQATSALDALLNRSHSRSSARCFDGLPAFFVGKYHKFYSFNDSITQKYSKKEVVYKLCSI
jgi:hypothetical protein